MAFKNRKELFVQMLSNARQGAERSTELYKELGQAVQDSNIKEAIEARGFVAKKILGTIDECFRLIGEQPVKPAGRFAETMIEDVRKELAEIQAPEIKLLFVLSKLTFFSHLAMGQLAALVAAADVTGHYAVGALLETCLADKMALAERTKRFTRKLVELKIEEKRAAA